MVLQNKNDYNENMLRAFVACSFCFSLLKTTEIYMYDLVTVVSLKEFGQL